MLKCTIRIVCVRVHQPCIFYRIWEKVRFCPMDCRIMQNIAHSTFTTHWLRVDVVIQRSGWNDETMTNRCFLWKMKNPKHFKAHREQRNRAPPLCPFIFMYCVNIRIFPRAAFEIEFWMKVIGILLLKFMPIAHIQYIHGVSCIKYEAVCVCVRVYECMTCMSQCRLG